MDTPPTIIVIIGPTASGKSDFAVEYALSHNGEIISADSRQLYKGLDIGTGKITEEEMKSISHHMLSVYELTEEISVARYARDTLPIIENILSRNKTPIICGGTGQYIDALIYETTLPPVPPNKKLREELDKESTEELFNRLEKKDMLRAQAIDKHNRVRLIRALEIAESLGTVPQQITSQTRFNTRMYIMSPTRETLRNRITNRLEKRLAGGMIKEVESIMKQGYTSDSLKRFGLEYVTIGKYLEKKLTYDEMKEELITKSMQYVKRQETWNKKYTKDMRIEVEIVAVVI